MDDCLEAQIGHLQKKSKFSWQAYLAAREISNKWWVSLLWPAESRRARARAEVSAEHSWEYALLLEKHVAQLTQHVKNVEGCLSLIGNPRSPEHLAEMVDMLREDGLHSLLEH